MSNEDRFAHRDRCGRCGKGRYEANAHFDHHFVTEHEFVEQVARAIAGLGPDSYLDERWRRKARAGIAVFRGLVA